LICGGGKDKKVKASQAKKSQHNSGNQDFYPSA
jgi:hypothetical protein